MTVAQFAIARLAAQEARAVLAREPLACVAQRILDEKGYFTFASKAKYADGSVLDGLWINPKDDGPTVELPGPLRVIGRTTKREFEQEHKHYYGSVGNWSGWRFYKAVAE